MNHARETVDTLVIGAGQAGVATSYWLTKAGVEHVVLERRDRLGGGWLDRWDSLCLVAPNFTILLPGKPYDGPDPDGFMARDEVVNYLKEYAASFGAPVRFGSGVKRLAASNDHLEATIEGGARFGPVTLCSRRDRTSDRRCRRRQQRSRYTFTNCTRRSTGGRSSFQRAPSWWSARANQGHRSPRNCMTPGATCILRCRSAQVSHVGTEGGT
jgi:NAD(P)-binding Rossmann-like domain